MYILNEMGCKSSKCTSTVHPRTASSAKCKSNIVHVQESPDAPSSTPEPDEKNLSSFPLHSAPPPSSSPPSLATELHLKLQDHANSRKRGRPSLLRQNGVDGDANHQDTVDQLHNQATIQNHISKDLDTTTEDYGVLLSPQLIPGQQFFPTGGNISSNNARYRPPVSSPFKRIHETDSQIEFFRMLDKRIEEGPEYSSDT